jgi:small subunit ribosomal protein S7
MGRRREKRDIQPDSLYGNIFISKLINQLMRGGKKSVATKVAYGAFDIIKEKTQKDPLEVFDLAIKNVSPFLEIKPMRVGGATYQVPREVRGDRKVALAMRWILSAAKAKKGKPMAEKLSEELIAASNNEGNAIKKKLDTQRMAEANKAFAHFAR